MTRFLGFVKTTAIGGLLVIIPVSIILFVLAQLFWGLYDIASSMLSSPLARRLDVQAADAILIFAVAAIALIGLCFLTGLLVRTRLGIALGNWFARAVAPRIPMYRALSNLTKRFIGVEGHEFAPVEVDLFGSSARTLGFLVETLPDGRCAVFVPTAPIATIGNVYLLQMDSVTFVDASVADAAGVITQWGVDSAGLYRTTGDQGDDDGLDDE